MVPALAFGIAQGLMPVVGWLGGALLASFIEAVDHWIAFGILVVLGGKFIWDSRGDVDIKPETFMSPLAIFVAAFATSIDACAVGGYKKICVNLRSHSIWLGGGMDIRRGLWQRKKNQQLDVSKIAIHEPKK